MYVHVCVCVCMCSCPMSHLSQILKWWRSGKKLDLQPCLIQGLAQPVLGVNGRVSHCRSTQAWAAKKELSQYLGGCPSKVHLTPKHQQVTSDYLPFPLPFFFSSSTTSSCCSEAHKWASYMENT